MFNYISMIIILFFSFFTLSCKAENELTMERGTYFYKHNNYNEAANQFNKVILSYPKNTSLIKTNGLEILAHAYQQLSLCQSKLALQSDSQDGREIYFKSALENIEKAMALATRPNKRQEYQKTFIGIKNQINF